MKHENAYRLEGNIGDDNSVIAEVFGGESNIERGTSALRAVSQDALTGRQVSNLRKSGVDVWGPHAPATVDAEY